MSRPGGAAGPVSAVPGGVEIQIKVIPRAGRTAIAGVRDGALLVRLAAAPVDGAANEALTELLASALGIPRRNVTILSGEHSKQKRVQVTGVSVAEAARATGILAAS
ncbi:MAG: DUF167 domain-containing protein [Vicinamibacterales bacterium]